MKRPALIALLCLIAYLLTCLLALAFGSSTVAPLQVVEHLFAGQKEGTVHAILWGARVPRVLFASIAGVALATGGVVFQAVLRNPLADPYILGVSGGAALSATLFMATGWASAWVGGVAGAALLGALGAIAGLLWAQRWLGQGQAQGQDLMVLLLTGVVFNAFASALITLIKAVVDARKAQELLMYLMGSLAVEQLSLGTIAACGGVVGLCWVGLFAHARALNLLGLGALEAQALGVDVRATRLRCVVLASVAVAVAVAYTGLIGFVGLIVPHALRVVMGPDHRGLLPAAALAGATLLVACDGCARAGFHLFDMTLPVGVVTALFGAPAFVLLLRRTLRSRGGE